jgi:hypothetical protein
MRAIAVTRQKIRTFMRRDKIFAINFLKALGFFDLYTEILILNLLYAYKIASLHVKP